MTNKELGTMIKEWWQDAIVNARDIRGDIPFDDAEELANGIAVDALMWAQESISHDDKIEFMANARNRSYVRMLEALEWCDYPDGFGVEDELVFDEFVAKIAYRYTRYVIRGSQCLSTVTSGKFFVNFGICEMLTRAGMRSDCNPFRLILSEIRELA